MSTSPASPPDVAIAPAASASPSIDFSSLVVIITGASEGIGLEVAKALASRGAKVVLAARSEEKLKAAAEAVAKLNPHAKALAIVADVTKRDAHAALLSETLRVFGKVDVWINNAGRGCFAPALDISDELFDEMMLVNTKSALYGMQCVIPYFKGKAAAEGGPSGHVINVSSLLGRAPFASVRAAYSAAKHALNALTTNVRVDLHNAGFAGIQVSTFSPGAVATNFGLVASAGAHDSRDAPGAQPAEEVAAAIVEMVASRAADAYSRPEYAHLISGYYAMSSAEREAREALPPWRAAGARAGTAGAPTKATPPS